MLQIKDLQEIVDIRIVENDTVALLSLKHDPRILDSIPIQLMEQFLQKHLIINGVNQQLLEDLCKNPKVYFDKPIEIAKGTVPKHGVDAKIEWLVFNYKNEKKPKVMEDGRVDYYSVNSVVSVRKGELLAQKNVSTKGEPGRTVKGKVIQPKPGKDVLFKIGKNVVINQEKDKIYAAIDGQLIIEDKIHVLPIYEIQGDVDFSVGNINFVGSVIVKGNVMEGFKIHADGDITIWGFVESAELISGGSIEISQGIIGRNKAKIRAEKNIKVAYITESDVYAGDSVHVSQSIMHSEVNAGKEVSCSGTKGLIVGGRVKAGIKVMASNIGNHLATSTSVEVGMNPLLRQELTNLQEKRREHFQTLDKIKKALHILDRLQRTLGSLPPDKKSLQIELLDKQLLLDKALKGIDHREKEIDQEMNTIEQASIEVRNVIYPGVKIVIGKYKKFIKDQQKYVKFVFEEGEIVTKQW